MSGMMIYTRMKTKPGVRMGKMRLGTETGSVMNHVYSMVKTKPEVGMGATILLWTDRIAATIVKITPTQVHVQEDKAERIDYNGRSECQEYKYSPDPSAPIQVFRMTKRGWRCKGRGLAVGDRRQYYDFSF